MQARETRSTRSRTPTESAASAPRSSRSRSPLARLQETAGNLAVHRSIERGRAPEIAVQRSGGEGGGGPVPIPEGKVGKAGPGQVIDYGDVTSCMTVTCHLRDGTKVGAHMVLAHTEEQHGSHVILDELRQNISGAVVQIELIGAHNFWKAGFLDRPAFDGGAAVDDPTSLQDKVLAKLGLQGAAVTTRNHDSGRLTV